MDIAHVIVIGIAPSLVVLGAGICRATWVWWWETIGATQTNPRARRSRV